MEVDVENDVKFRWNKAYELFMECFYDIMNMDKSFVREHCSNVFLDKSKTDMFEVFNSLSNENKRKVFFQLASRRSKYNNSKKRNKMTEKEIKKYIMDLPEVQILFFYNEFQINIDKIEVV